MINEATVPHEPNKVGKKRQLGFFGHLNLFLNNYVLTSISTYFRKSGV